MGESADICLYHIGSSCKSQDGQAARQIPPVRPDESLEQWWYQGIRQETARRTVRQTEHPPAQQLESLQQFVRQNGLRLEDAEQLTEWVRRQAVISIQIYRDGELYYDSDYDGYDREDFGGEMGPPPWSDLRDITFADGDAQVLLYGFYVFQIYHYALIVELLVYGRNVKSALTGSI